MRQLEQWNAESFGYSAPTAEQYLASERQLASLDRLPRARGANDVAPVLMAMVTQVAMPAAKSSQPSAADKPVVAGPNASTPAASRHAAPTRAEGPRVGKNWVSPLQKRRAPSP